MIKNIRKKPEEIFVSVVLIANETCRHIDRQIKQISKILFAQYANYEVLIIDNHMPPTELDKATGLLAELPCLRIVRLSKVVTRDTAAFAGLEASIGDYVVLMVASHDPPAKITDFINKNRKVDIVFGISARQLRRGLLNRYGSAIFYWYNKRYLGLSIPVASTYFMSLSRRAINAATTSERFARHIRYMARQIGYQSDELVYHPLASVQPEKKRAHQLVISALELASGYSKHPLRFVSWLGLAGAGLNLIYGTYVILVRVFKHDVVEGWTTLSLQLAIMFFFLFLILAVLCEYVGKILEESRNETPYHVMEELTSKVSLANVNRRNIVR